MHAFVCGSQTPASILAVRQCGSVFGSCTHQKRAQEQRGSAASEGALHGWTWRGGTWVGHACRRVLEQPLQGKSVITSCIVQNGDLSTLPGLVPPTCKSGFPAPPRANSAPRHCDKLCIPAQQCCLRNTAHDVTAGQNVSVFGSMHIKPPQTRCRCCRHLYVCHRLCRHPRPLTCSGRLLLDFPRVLVLLAKMHLSLARQAVRLLIAHPLLGCKQPWNACLAPDCGGSFTIAWFFFPQKQMMRK